MPTATGLHNFYIDNYKSSQEQRLLESLITESISICGLDVYYVPRVIGDLDKLYTADDQSSYTNAILLCMYIENVDGFQGQGNFMSKFGLEIRDQVTFSVSMRVFEENVEADTGQERPNEGDLVYLPLNQKCFQIKFVEKFEMFFMLGRVYTWKLTCELFEYSDELFETGIPGIDRVQKELSTDVLDWAWLFDDGVSYVATEDGSYIVLESYNMDAVIGTGTNQDIQAEANAFIMFNISNPFESENI